MYRSFYNLTQKPFQISSDPSFMWLGEKHKEALATLKYGILDNKGFLLLTGDVGTGKTTLINALVQSLSDDVICTSVPDPGLDKLDFFNYIGAAFGIEKEFASKGSFLTHFRKFLIQSNEDGKKVLLIIDEAQLLTQELLEEIRLLSNIEKTDTKLINIFFIGQNEFNEILNQQQNRAVRQRLTLNYNIDPLTPDETAEYITHRLAIAGTSDPIFDDWAKQEVFIFSGGFPRRINIICDHCLLSGYVKEQKIINAQIVKECAQELKIPERVRNRDINGFVQYQGPQFPPAKAQVNPQLQAQLQSYPVQPPDMVNEKKDRKLNIALGIILFLVFILFAWFLMFPNHFHDSITGFKQNIQYITGDKYTIVKPISVKPDSIKQDSDLNALAHKEVEQTEQPIETKDLESIKKKILKNGNTDLVVNTVRAKPVTKIQPIQEEILKPANNITPKDISTDISKTAILPLPKEKIIVRFKYNNNDFTEDGYIKLVDFADILVAHPDTNILISGYTDSEGYKKYNRKLSEFRANIVRSFFLGRGVHSQQIQVKGRGSEEPIESNDTAWGRMMNRRVEIQVLQ
ncbi:MAG: AAA family ATPase [Pseudomonadota bacterium]